MKILITFFLSSFVTISIIGQKKEENPINLILLQHKNVLGEQIVENLNQYKVQIIYTQIDRNKKNEAKFTTFELGNSQEYFYPASTVKLFASALALEKINKLNIKELDKEDIMETDSSYSGQTSVKIDSTSKNLKPSIAHYVKKILVTSDNDAFNRLYELIGQEAFNDNLKQKGFRDTRITHRLSIALSSDENKHTNKIDFYDEKTGQNLYTQNPQFSSRYFGSDQSIFLGKAYLKGEEIIQEPMDFKEKNFVSAKDLHRLILCLMFPENFKKSEQFDLTKDDYRFLYQYMSQLPRETTYPDYGGLNDNYCKFLMFGDKDQERIPENIRIFNKIGNAYGFTIDNAYIVDFKNNIEFALTAVIYTNQNQTLNDGNYEYKTQALPFLGALGRAVYAYELDRMKSQEPDLSNFKTAYDR